MNVRQFITILALILGSNSLSPKIETPQTIEPLFVPTAIEPITDTVNQKDLKCLTENVYHEAPYESDEGRLAVATVTMNRVESGYFPKSICGVVYQRSKYGCQFSWVCGRGIKVVNQYRYEKALTTAKLVLYNNERHEGIKNSLYFHGVSVHPSWTSDLKRVTQIGPHVFYSIPKRSR